MRTHRSKIGLEFVIPLSIILGGIAALFIVNKIWPGLAVILLVIIFVAYTLASTRYTLNGSTLRIRCGLFFDRTIDIPKITSVKTIHNAMSAPAASLDRMEIRYAAHETVLISPVDKTAFLTDLKRINPKIDVDVPGFK